MCIRCIKSYIEGTTSIVEITGRAIDEQSIDCNFMINGTWLLLAIWSPIIFPFVSMKKLKHLTERVRVV